MRIIKTGGSRFTVILFMAFLLGTITCDKVPLLNQELSAQSEIGAKAPPIEPLEVRMPQFGRIFADVAEKVIPSVVSIRSEKVVQVPYFDPFDWFFGYPWENQQRQGPRYREHRQEGIGSGVIVSEEGYIMTNNHVVEGADDLTVKLSDGREFPAIIVGTDPPSDLAVIKIKEAKDLPVAFLGQSEDLRVGEMVIAIGSPFGLSETVTLGIVSAKGRSTGGSINQYENFIQTDAAINPGNSGGALVNLDGEVVGINTAIYSRSGGYQGIGFAIPIDMAKRITDDLISEGYVSRGWLGVGIQDITADLARSLDVEPGSGVLISEVFENTPAEKAGIQPTDIVVEMNGEAVTSTTELRNKVAMIKPGTEVRLKVLRNGKEKNIKIVLDERPDEQGLAGGRSESLKEKTGLTLQNLTPPLMRQYDIKETQKGVFVMDVEPGSTADRARIRPGDIILEVDRKEVNSVSEFNKIISRTSKDTVLIRALRRGLIFFAPLSLK